MSLLQIRPKRQITLPSELAQKLDLEVGDYLEAQVEGNRLVLSVKEVRDRSKRIALSDMIGTAQGAFSSAEDVDQYIANGRNDDR